MSAASSSLRLQYGCSSGVAQSEQPSTAQMGIRVLTTRTGTPTQTAFGKEKQDGVDKAQKSASLAPLAGAVASITQKIDAFIENIVGDTVQDRHVSSLILAILRQLVEGVGRGNLIIVFSAVQGIEPQLGHKWASGQKHGRFLSSVFESRCGHWAVVEDLRGDIPLATRYQLLERLRQEVAVYNNGLAMSILYGHRNHCLSLEAEASNFFRVAWAADGQAFTINGDHIEDEDEEDDDQEDSDEDADDDDEVNDKN
ncbi:hypothetical protein OC835_006207 [Tilletia horrida]|nr:hypothetical protein OC835_006207 [Tilletia horrida]